MSVLKCKICGGSLEFTGEASVCVCQYCGTKQTLPRFSDEHSSALYERADHFRRNNDFDKAISIYEQILNENNTDAEAYWSLVLCRYGVEYVEDPKSNKRIATVNRMQYTSVLVDEDYKAAIKYAEGEQKAIYESEAKEIDSIQKGILQISQREEPFDVFICYKETDNNGRRTQDSVLANELYHQLDNEGYKVFFSRITLEDKLGSAYEPYIFAALNSAKVMVVIGTKPEYFNAVWVRNEWSRFLTLIKNGANKVLIPAYRDMDPYNLPEEFSYLQAQDMSKLGFMQDLIRGIEKLIGKSKPQAAPVQTVDSSANTAPLLRRAYLFLEDGDWASANEYCEKVLDQNPECGEAYLGKLMAELKVRRRELLAEQKTTFDKNPNYQKALRFGDEKLKKELNAAVFAVAQREKQARLAAEEESRGRCEEQTIATDKRKRLFKTVLLIAVPLLLLVIYMVCVQSMVVNPGAPSTSQTVKNSDFSFAVLSDGTVEITGYKGTVTNVTIPKTLDGRAVTSIGASAFRGSSLESITIPEGVTSIGTSSISDCSSLKSISLPDSILSIGDYAFSGCGSLGSISLPDSVTSIGASAFRGSSLESITIPEGVTSIGESTFSGCTSLVSISIPDSILSVGDYAFSGCGSLGSISLPDSVTSIGDHAFGGCTSLGSISLPDSILSIGDYAFFGCRSLESITIPEGVICIGANALDTCTSLRSVTIPKSVTDIGWGAFLGCDDLIIQYGGSADDRTKIRIGNANDALLNATWSYGNSTEVMLIHPDYECSLSNGKVTIIKYKGTATNVTIPSQIDNYPVVRIGDDAFRLSSVESITIPEGVTSIGQEAFSHCKALQSIAISDSVILIGDEAFNGCSSLDSITLPEGVTSIGSGFFVNCEALQSITIPDSVSNIGFMAFGYCDKLKYIYYRGSVADREKIAIDDSNSWLLSATWLYNSEE